MKRTAVNAFETPNGGAHREFITQEAHTTSPPDQRASLEKPAIDPSLYSWKKSANPPQPQKEFIYPLLKAKAGENSQQHASGAASSSAGEDSLSPSSLTKKITLRPQVQANVPPSEISFSS